MKFVSKFFLKALFHSTNNFVCSVLFFDNDIDVNEVFIRWMIEVIEEDVYRVQFITLMDQYKEWYLYHLDSQTSI